MSSRLLLYGAGGHGKVVADAVEKEGCFELAGFVDDRPLKEFYGLSVLGSKADLSSIRQGGVEHAVSCVGDGKVRKMLDERLEKAGFLLATVVHPSAQVARGAVIGKGSVIMPGAVVGPDCLVGRSCIVNTQASVDHDCVLADYVQLAPGASVCGNVRVESGTLVGAGASVLPNLRIGERAVVAGGATVVQDVSAGVTVAGTPARAVTERGKV